MIRLLERDMTDISYGLQERFEESLEIICKINSLKSLLNNSDNFYPEGFKTQYKKDINELIKCYEILLGQNIDHLSKFYREFNYKEDGDNV